MGKIVISAHEFQLTSGLCFFTGCVYILKGRDVFLRLCFVFCSMVDEIRSSDGSFVCKNGAAAWDGKLINLFLWLLSEIEAWFSFWEFA